MFRGNFDWSNLHTKQAAELELYSYNSLFLLVITLIISSFYQWEQGDLLI